MNQRLRLVIALLLPFAACGLQWLLWEDWIKPYVWFLFFPVAFFSAWLGGLLGGIGATLISALLVWYVFITPQFSFALTNPASVFSVVIFFGMGCLFSWFHAKLRRALSSSESRFVATFEQAAVGIALVGADGSFQRVNRRLCEIVGYSAEELMTRNFKDITHPDDLAADLANVRRVLAGESDTFAMEKRYICKDGSIAWVKLSAALTRKAGGTPDYFISVIEDITARKLAEAARHELELRLEDAKHLAQLGYWHWDLRSGMHVWSPEIHAIYGRDPSLGAASFEEVQRYFTPESWPKLGAAVEQGMQRGQAYECDAEVVRADGEHRWVIARGEAIRDGDGEVIALHGSLQDITARKQVELDLQRRNQELERFNQASIDRELQMIVLKQQVNSLTRELGRAAPYELSFIDAEAQRDQP